MVNKPWSSGLVSFGGEEVDPRPTDDRQLVWWQALGQQQHELWLSTLVCWPSMPAPRWTTFGSCSALCCVKNGGGIWGMPPWFFASRMPWVTWAFLVLLKSLVLLPLLLGFEKMFGEGILGIRKCCSWKWTSGGFTKPQVAFWGGG